MAPSSSQPSFVPTFPSTYLTFPPNLHFSNYNPAPKIFDLVQWVFLLLSISHGYGHHPDYVAVPDFLPLAKYLFLSQPFSAWALACAKISVACCLLRVQRGAAHPSNWRMFLYSLVGVQVIITGIINYFQFTMCRPLRANWGEYAPDSQCVDSSTAQTSIYVNLSMVAFTDLAFSLLPLSMLRDRPPVHEKVAICCMVFVGFLATSATLARMIFVHKFIIGSMLPQQSRLVTFLLTHDLNRGSYRQWGWLDNLH